MTATVPPVDIWHLLFEREDQPFPDNHVIFQNGASKKAYTFQDVKSLSQQFARALQVHWNWRKGDVLVLMAPNDIDTPIVTWGCHYNGGIVAPVNPGLSPPELSRQLASSQAKGMVVHHSCLKTALEAAESIKFPLDRLLVMQDTEPTNSSPMSVTQFMRDAAVMSTPPASIDPVNDTAFLVYSSGTTGHPKGVMVSHQNVVADVVLQAAIEGPHVDWRRDRTLAVLPIYHIYGLICLVHLPVWLGTSAIFMEKFELQTFCRLIQEYSIAHAYVAPPIVLHLAKNREIDSFHLSTLRMITSGGAPLTPALIKEAHQRWKIPVRQAYGLSETTSVSHIQRWDDWEEGLGSSGPPLPGVDAKIVLQGGRRAQPKQEGELWIRGPTVFNGYMNNAVATGQCMTEDGWFKTGDIGFEDDRQNLYITDRAKDMIKYKGYQIAPTELEDILLDHPAVEDAAVIGLWNEDLQTEVPLAYVVLKSSESTEVAMSIIDSVKRKTTHYKHLRGGVIWIAQIPKSPSGKILKRTLRERASTLDQGKRIGALEYDRYRGAKI